MSNILTKPENKSQLAMVMESRQLADAQTAIYLSKQFPRDPDASLLSILKECQRPRVAEAATYSYSRGDSEVKGASIRLAEVIARHWGNFNSGADEIERRNGESVVKAYAWDYESNYRDEKIFTVRHMRNTKRGSYALTDERDIYELIANNAARRKRACILAVIPAYVVDEALAACQETLEAAIGTGADLDLRKSKMLEAFKAFDERIDETVLAAKIGKDYDKFGAKDIVRLANLYNAIKDGFVKAGVAFDFEKEEPSSPSVEEEEETTALNEQLGVTLS